MIEAVREAVTNSPHTSTRKLGRQLGATQKVAHKILKKHLKWRPWKRHTTQKLVAQDHARRLEFSEFMIERVSFHGPIRIVNRSFRFFLLILKVGVADAAISPEVVNIMWTDECNFDSNGGINRRNEHHYSEHNPHCRKETHIQVNIKMIDNSL